MLNITDSTGTTIDYYVYESQKLVITPNTVATTKLYLFWQLLDYPSVKSQSVTLELVVAPVSTTPYFSDGNPYFKYTMTFGSTL